jgi:hypothetical protein
MGTHVIERRLGRCPSPVEKINKRLRLTDFADVPYILPKIPQDFGHEMVVPARGWGMNLNDQLGDCVIAGAYHEHLLWNLTNGRTFNYTDRQVLRMYEDIAGYDPKRPETDGGTDMAAAASYRRTRGIPDKSGHRHKIDAYVALEPGNWEQLRVCIYLFGAAAIGMLFTDQNWDQYQHGRPWDSVAGAKADGGHYVPAVGDRQGIISCVTWGSLQGMTRKCYDKQVDEALGYVSKEYLNRKGKTPEGFDMPALLKAVAAVTKVQEPTMQAAKADTLILDD